MSLCRSNSAMIRSPSVKRFQPENNQIDDSTMVSGESSIVSSMKLKLSSVVELGKTLFSPPYLKYIVLTCFVDFGLMFRWVIDVKIRQNDFRTLIFQLWFVFNFSYYTLMMWFPDLFERFGHFAQLHPGESAGVCQVSSIVTLEGEVRIFNIIFIYSLFNILFIFQLINAVGKMWICQFWCLLTYSNSWSELFTDINNSRTYNWQIRKEIFVR